jgi:hypothetical protein
LLSTLGLIVMGKLLFQTLFIQALIGFPIILALVIWPNRKLHRIVVPLLFVWLYIRTRPARLLIA